MRIRSLALAAALGAALAGLMSCSGPQPASGENGSPPPASGKQANSPSPPPAGFPTPEEAGKAFFEAKILRDFGRIWDLSAEEPRRMLLGMAKSIAEESDEEARKAGLASAEEAKALDLREFYVRMSMAYAARGEFVYPEGSRLKGVSVEPREDLGGLPARKAVLALEGGGADEVFVVKEGDSWKIWEK